MIHIDHLCKTYDRHSKAASQALYDISFDLPDTGFICIVGPSGCGKTSLLNAIGGLDTFDGGSVSTENLTDLRCGSARTEAERNRSFGYIFQNYYLLPEYSAAYNIYLGLHSLELGHKEKLKRVMEALKAVGMERFARRAVGELSGGQQQRVAIARALARRPKIIFADEPTGNLDEENTMNICMLLRQISKNSLVIMVTHEERIARFFADRIITLASGRLLSDNSTWQRGSIVSSGNTLYTGDFKDSTCQADGLTLRLLQENGAPDVDLTVLVQKDRIIIKLDSSKPVTLAKSDEPPQIIEGDRPLLKLETLDHEAVNMVWDEPVPQGKAGKGLPFSMLMQEAQHLLRRKGVQRFGTWLFLVVLAVFTTLTVGDYLMISSLEPEDFITTDSHILEIQLERGQALGADTLTVQNLIPLYVDYLNSSGLDFDYIPRIPVSAEYSASVFLQMGNIFETLSGFSYVSLDRFSSEDLILGRLPEFPDEIIVDRWILESLMEREGIIQNGISDVSYFLERELNYSKKNCSLTIVGISDCGEPDIFVDKAIMISLGTAGNEVISLSDLKRQFPKKYDSVLLEADECLVITNNAGMDYANRIGGLFNANNKQVFTIVDAIEEDTYASLVLADTSIEPFLQAMMTSDFYVYCQDKTAMKDYLSAGLPDELEGKIQVSVIDKNSDSWAQYRLATGLRMDSRRIVTFTVIAVSMVMLYLLQRSRVQERIGMVAVYRLLGIPGCKLGMIFALECILLSLISTLPTAALTWLIVAFLSKMPSLEIPFLLPWYAASGVYLCILLFHILASLLPLYRLLQLPPARLAAKYDF